MRVARVHLLRDLDRQAEALAEAERLAKERPNTVEGLTARADALTGLDRRDEADRDYAAALKLKPGDETARFGRGGLRLLRGDYPGALSDFDAVVAIAPDTPELYVYRALAHSGALDNKAALADWTWRAGGRSALRPAARGDALHYLGRDRKRWTLPEALRRAGRPRRLVARAEFRARSASRGRMKDIAAPSGRADDERPIRQSACSRPRALRRGKDLSRDVEAAARR